MELKLLNFGHADPVEVRIIKVTADSTFENLNDEFQPMDLAGVEQGIILGIPTQITCDDARSFASVVSLDTENTGSFTVEVGDNPPETFDNLEELINGLQGSDFRLIELFEWAPPPVES